MNTINLLPPDLKQQYRYARRNSALLRMLSLFGLGLVGLIIIVVYGLIYLEQASDTYVARTVTAKEGLVKQQQSEIQKQVEDISGSLKLAVQVLSKEVLFSKLLKQLAVVVPSNVSLSGINIIEPQGAVDITAQTSNYEAASQLQINLADPANQIFVKADVVSISCSVQPASTTSPYPCTVTIRALFAEDNSFLFINNKGEG